jgi:hypothetical protein
VSAALLLLLTLAGADGKPPKPQPSPSPRVYTNDDLETYREEREQAGGATPAPTPTPVEAPPAPSGEEGGAGNAHVESVKRARESLAEAEAARDKVKTRVASLEASLNPMSVEFEPDPNITLKLQAELTEARAALVEAESVVATARAELENAEDLAKRGGQRLPPRER